MSPELDQLLCSRYPEIFAQRHLPMAQTLMCFGFGCGDGWFALINRLCADLQACVAAGTIPQPVAVQVKQKYAELRFYVANNSDEAQCLIDEAMDRSLETCETCGAPGVVRVDHHWYRTRCDAHAPAGSTSEPS